MTVTKLSLPLSPYLPTPSSRDVTALQKRPVLLAETRSLTSQDRKTLNIIMAGDNVIVAARRIDAGPPGINHGHALVKISSSAGTMVLSVWPTLKGNILPSSVVRVETKLNKLPAGTSLGEVHVAPGKQTRLASGINSLLDTQLGYMPWIRDCYTFAANMVLRAGQANDKPIPKYMYTTPR